MATLLRRYFVRAHVDETLVKTVQPSNIRLYSIECHNYVGAGSFAELRQALPRLIEKERRDNLE